MDLASPLTWLILLGCIMVGVVGKRWIDGPFTRWAARTGQTKARQILDDAGIEYDLWCDECELPVPTRSTPTPDYELQPGERTECLLDHPKHHKIRHSV